MINNTTTPRKGEIRFFRFIGDSTTSSPDSVTVPPRMGTIAIGGRGIFHAFGEWLKREGHNWEYTSAEELCRLCVDYWNVTARIDGQPTRRFDRVDHAHGDKARRPARIRRPISTTTSNDLPPAEDGSVKHVVRSSTHIEGQ